MKELKDVKQFSYSYRIYNRLTGKYTAVFDSIKSAIDNALESGFIGIEEFKYKKFLNIFANTVKTKKLIEISTKHSSMMSYNEWKIISKIKFQNSTEIYTMIEVETNAIVSLDIIEANYKITKNTRDYKNLRKINDNKIRRIKFYKKNIRRIKKNYSVGTHYFYNEMSLYPCEFLGYHASVSTTNEIRLLEGIVNEYEREYPGLVRGKRKNLPTSWDDQAISAYATHKSWKHNSKRKKQWVPKVN